MLFIDRLQAVVDEAESENPSKIRRLDEDNELNRCRTLFIKYYRDGQRKILMELLSDINESLEEIDETDEF